MLDANLERLDGFGFFERITRPSDFNASSKPSYERAAYFLLLVASVLALALLAVAVAMRKPGVNRWLRRLGWVYLLLFALGLRAYLRVLEWL